MKYGVFLPNFDVFNDIRLLALWAHQAEQVGWDGFFIWDHVSYDGRFPNYNPPVIDPWVALTAIALNTRYIRLGALITPLPRRRVQKVARETVTVDHLSNGRLVFGAGIGGRPAEFENLGEITDAIERGAMLDEGLYVLTQLWSGDRFSFEGQYCHVNDTQFLPTPVQSPRIPIWVGGRWNGITKAPFRRAALYDGVIPELVQENQAPLEQFKAAVAYVNSQRTNEDPYDIVHMDSTYKLNRQDTLEKVGGFWEAGATWWLEHLNYNHFGHSVYDWDVEAMHQHLLAGPPKPG